MPQYTIRTAEHTRDFTFILHAADCSDIEKDARVYGGYTETIEGETAELAAQAWLKSSGYSSADYGEGWKLSDIRMLPCCKRPEIGSITDEQRARIAARRRKHS